MVCNILLACVARHIMVFPSIQCKAVFPFTIILIQMKGDHGYMKTLVGGAIAAILGVIGIVAWFPQFLTVLAGTIPVMLLLGGALAIYLGVDELK